MLLHTERATRESVGPTAARGFVRYADLLDDWVRRPRCASARSSSCEHVLHASSEAIRDGHRFVDPTLRRMTPSLDDLDLPPRLHELTAETWTELNKLAEPGGDTADVHTTLDQLRGGLRRPVRGGRGDPQSSVVAAEQRTRRQVGRRSPDPAGRRAVADRVAADAACARSWPPAMRRGAAEDGAAGRR